MESDHRSSANLPEVKAIGNGHAHCKRCCQVDGLGTDYGNSDRKLPACERCLVMLRWWRVSYMYCWYLASFTDCKSLRSYSGYGRVGWVHRRCLSIGVCLTFVNQIRPTIQSVRHLRLWRDDSHIQAHRKGRYFGWNGLSRSRSSISLRRHTVIHACWAVTLICDTVLSISFVFGRLTTLIV